MKRRYTDITYSDYINIEETYYKPSRYMCIHDKVLVSRFISDVMLFGKEALWCNRLFITHLKDK